VRCDNWPVMLIMFRFHGPAAPFDCCGALVVFTCLICKH
jgi:hypothetical protein